MFKQLLAVLVPVFMLAVLAAPALAISMPSVAFIPDKVSINGAFLVIADPHQTQGESLIVVWEKDLGKDEINNKGSFPRVSGKYVCYFSNTDNESTCGPAPFKVIDPARKFFVTAINQDNTSGTTVANLSVGDIVMQASSLITGGGKNLTVTWSTGRQGSFYYKIYYVTNLSETGQTGIVLFDGDRMNYWFSIPISPGNYFVSLRFDESGTGRFGGTILRISIPESGIYLPGGEFLPSNLIVTPASFEVLLNKNQNYPKTGFSITNVGTIPVGNMTTEMPSGLGQYISISFSNNTITPNGTIFYTITIGTQHSLSINTRVNITSNNITIGQIPVNVNVSIVNECEGAAPSQCPGMEAGGISIDQQTWTGDYLAGQPAIFNFTITNLGNATLSNFNHSSNFGDSLSVQLPGTLLSKRYAAASAKLDQSYAGRQSGHITIITPQGSASIAVSLNFHEDISSSITDLELEYADFKSNLTASQSAALASVFTDIDSDISGAESDQESERYGDAETHYNSAAAKLSALKNVFSGSAPPINPPSGGGIDMITILIVIIVVVAAAFAYIIIKRRRGRGGEEELEEELAEDFGPLPPAEG